MIALKVASIYWKRDGSSIRVFEHLSDEYKRWRASEGRVGWSDGGASDESWRCATSSEQIQTVLELAIKLMVDGYDPKQIICEFSKIREFYALGNSSHYMCNAITKAITDEAYDCEGDIDASLRLARSNTKSRK